MKSFRYAAVVAWIAAVACDGSAAPGSGDPAGGSSDDGSETTQSLDDAECCVGFCLGFVCVDLVP